MILVTTSPNRESRTTPSAQSGPIAEAMQQPLAIPDSDSDPTRQAIVQALQTLLHTLSISPAGNIEVTALRRQLFQLTAPDSGSTIAIPNPLRPGDAFTLPVETEVRWEILGEAGRPLVSETEFIADPPTLDALNEQVLFFPPVVRNEGDVSRYLTLTLCASVSLAAIHPIDGKVIREPHKGRTNLPPVTITVPVALRVPSILTFFRHKSFAAQPGDEQVFAFIFVPPGSRLQSLEDLSADGALGALMEEAGALRAAIESLPVSDQSLVATLAGNLEGYIDGLSELMSALARFGPSSSSPVAVISAPSHSNLNMADAIPGIRDSIEGGDGIGSLILLGLGEAVTLYNNSEFRANQGILQIETGAQMCAVVDRLDTSMPTASVGDPVITVPDPADSSNLPIERPGIFSNKIASFHFGKNPLS